MWFWFLYVFFGVNSFPEGKYKKKEILSGLQKDGICKKKTTKLNVKLKVDHDKVLKKFHNRHVPSVNENWANFLVRHHTYTAYTEMLSGSGWNGQKQNKIKKRTKKKNNFQI